MWSFYFKVAYGLFKQREFIRELTSCHFLLAIFAILGMSHQLIAFEYDKQLPGHFYKTQNKNITGTN